MPKPRKYQISLEATPYYHCISRCVRQAFLYGTDQHTGQTYEHRRQWLEDKIIKLSSIFALDICAYTVMSNHYHMVLHIDSASSEAWCELEVVERWYQLFTGNLLSQHYLSGDVLSVAEKAALQPCIDVWRKRLCDISWYMRVLNEQLARLANQEDQCTGRFWEGRYKCQALLDEAALLACMAYVDLNPIRAAMAKTPETSQHTSIKRRINQSRHPTDKLMPFAGNIKQDMPKGLPYNTTDYLILVEWTGRIMRGDKRGHIPHDIPLILERLRIDPKQWCYLTQHFESPFKGLVGSLNKLKQAGELFGYQQLPGKSSCRLFFS